MHFSTLSIYTLFALLSLLAPTQANPHNVPQTHPKRIHSIPPHRRDVQHLENRDLIVKNTKVDSREKVKIRRKKRTCQVPVGITTSPSTSTSTTVIGGVHVVQSSTAESSMTESSTTTSAAGAAETGNASTSPSSGFSGLMQSLFPMSTESSWTTCPESSDPMSFTSALNPLQFGKLPSISNAPDGQSALIANYPAGTFHYSASTGHGYSFYTSGAHNNVIVSGAKEVLFSYSVFFQDGFQFNKGGKLPGLYGGTSLDNAKSCSGGRQDSRDQCFSARLMWRTNGMGEIYNYYPNAVYGNSAYCNTPPLSKCDTTYGDSIGRGSFTFPTGQWVTVSQRLKLNDVGSSNGEQELFVNGVSTINLSGLQIAVEDGTQIYGIMAQTFFGGSDATWASPIDQSAWFKDWSLAVLA